MPLTAFTLEARLLDKIAPGDSDRFYQILSEADERLLESGRWHWTRAVLDLTVTDKFATLDAQYASIAGARIGSTASGVLWQDIDYLEGAQSAVCIQGCASAQLIDRGLVSGVRTYESTEDIESVAVLARFAPVTITAPTDTPLCQCFAALKQAMLGILYENANDQERCQLYFATARQELDRQEAAYRGIAKKIHQPKLFGPIKRRSRSNFP